MDSFLMKILRNGLILGGIYFFSMWAGLNELSFEACKPIIIFIGLYILGELAHHYRVSTSGIPKKKICAIAPLVF